MQVPVRPSPSSWSVGASTLTCHSRILLPPPAVWGRPPPALLAAVGTWVWLATANGDGDEVFPDPGRACACSLYRPSSGYGSSRFGKAVSNREGYGLRHDAPHGIPFRVESRSVPLIDWFLVSVLLSTALKTLGTRRLRRVCALHARAGAPRTAPQGPISGNKENHTHIYTGSCQ